jgi:protein-tyrosine phosphatase
MSTYRIKGPWSGALTIVSRPRGGDWLEDDLQNWKRAAISVLHRVEDLLAAGRNVGLHCRQSIGRSGMIAAALLVMSGFEPLEAIACVTNARGLPVPETEAQREWVIELAQEFQLLISQR